MVGRRRPPTKRERIFGYAGSLIFVTVGAAILLATHALAGLGVWAFALGGWILFLVSIWGRVVGYLVARATSPVLVARKIPKDERSLGRQRISAVVEMVVGFCILFLFGALLITGIAEMLGGTAPGSLLAAAVTVLIVAALTAVGMTLFWRGWKRWRRIARSDSSRLAKTT